MNTQIREVLKREGAIAAEDARIDILAPSGMTDQEKHFARFYSGGQVVMFARDNAGLGIAAGAEYRVSGLARDARGRQIVRLVDEKGRTILWNPRLGRASQVNVFIGDKRDIAAGDRIQWRLATKELDLKNAERGTIECLDGTVATIRWDRSAEPQKIDLAVHRTWDHGYAETVYSAQSKTYDRVYVLAPVGSGLVNGQNYYTAITRARYGVKLWTEDLERLVQKLERYSGEKTSSLEGLGRLWRDSHRIRGARLAESLDWARKQMLSTRADRAERRAEREREWNEILRPPSLAEMLAGRARDGMSKLDAYLNGILAGSTKDQRAHAPTAPEPAEQPHSRQQGHDR